MAYFNYGVPVNCPYTQYAQFYEQDSLYRSPENAKMPSLPDSWKFGPIKIEWAFDGESINCVLKVLEKAVKEMVLTLSKPSISITTDIGDVQVNLKVNADFIKDQVSISGSICFETICTIFNNTVVAKW